MKFFNMMYRPFDANLNSSAYIPKNPRWDNLANLIQIVIIIALVPLITYANMLMSKDDEATRKKGIIYQVIAWILVFVRAMIAGIINTPKAASEYGLIHKFDMQDLLTCLVMIVITFVLTTFEVCLYKQSIKVKNEKNENDKKDEKKEKTLFILSRAFGLVNAILTPSFIAALFIKLFLL